MIRLSVNGVPGSFEGDPEMPVLWYLRDILGLTGTKFGCGAALCGACTVHRNGVAIRSCVVPIHAVEGAEITTIEGIAGRDLHTVQKAWMDFSVPQCRLLPGWTNNAGNIPAEPEADTERSRYR